MTEKELLEIELRCEKAQDGPWKAFVEGRDHECGSSFIMTGLHENRGNDIELFGASIYDFDFIANSKQDIPKLIFEIRNLKEQLAK